MHPMALSETSSSTGVDLYRLGLNLFGPKMFKMGLIIVLEIGFG
jgi:hypothetical protein